MKESVLQRELRKRRPFDLPEQEAALNLFRTQDFLAGAFESLFEQHGLSPQQYNVLRILRGHGGDGLPSLEIASQMITRAPDITRLVDRLEKCKLAERFRTDADRRLVLVRITKDGLDVLAKLDRPILDLHKQLLGRITRSELAELSRLLVKARTAS